MGTLPIMELGAEGLMGCAHVGSVLKKCAPWKGEKSEARERGESWSFEICIAISL